MYLSKEELIANGWILLCGIAQHGKKFEIEGVENGEKIENDFLTTIRKLFRYAKLSENAGHHAGRVQVDSGGLSNGHPQSLPI